MDLPIILIGKPIKFNEQEKIKYNDEYYSKIGKEFRSMHNHTKK